MEKKKIGEWKEIMVKGLSDEFKKGSNVYISDYTGLKADELNELRQLLKPSLSKYLVLKNSIAKRALENAGLGKLKDLITGGTGMIFGGDDPIAAARVAHKFSKTHGALTFRGGYLDGKIIGIDRIKYIASIPGREELLRRIALGIKSPIYGFVSVLGNALRNVVYVIQAIKTKKGG